MKTSGKRVQSPLSPSVSTKRHGDPGDDRSTPSDAPPHVRERAIKRAARLSSLGYASYNAYLASERWQDLKRRYRASSLPQTCVCGDDDVHLYHTTYERVGEEKLSDLTPLCRSCHSLVHVLEWRGQVNLNLDGFVLDADRAAQGRALLAQLVEDRQRAHADRLAEEQALVRSLPFATRLLRAVRHAKANRRDVTRQVRFLRMHVEHNRSNKTMTRQLRAIEEIAYAWEGWRDQA